SARPDAHSRFSAIQDRNGTTLVSQLRTPGQSGKPPEVTPARVESTRSGPPESPWHVSCRVLFLGRQHSERASWPATRPARLNRRGHFLSRTVPNCFSPKVPVSSRP